MIDGKHFEQYFSESKLKQGLKIFESELIELLRHPSENKYYFLVNRTEIFLSRKRDKITNYTCSCSQKKFCEHLAATLFYFYRDTLLRVEKKSTVSKKQLRLSIDKPLSNSSVQTPKLTQQLVRVKKIIQPFAAHASLSNTQLEELLNKLKRGRDASDNNLFYFDLALCIEYYSVKKFRFTGDEKFLDDFYNLCLISLQTNYDKGLSEQKIIAWQHASILALRSNAVLLSRFGFFLIPRFLRLTNVVTDVLELRQKLIKRKLKLHHSETIDPLKIALLQVDLSLSELQGHTFKAGLDLMGAELSIARAELYFCSKRNRKAFGLLEKEHLRIKSDFKQQYLQFLDYIIFHAQNKSQKNIEAQYLQERLVYGLFISEADVQRLFKLVPVKERATVIDALIRRIGKSKEHYAFDKLSFLLMREKRFDELIREIKRHKNQFHLLHELVIKKLPDYSDELLEIYVRHLSEALSDAKYYEVQQLLFKEALNYITNLPVDAAFKILRALLDKIGHQAQISKHIQLKAMEHYGEQSLDL